MEIIILIAFVIGCIWFYDKSRTKRFDIYAESLNQTLLSWSSKKGIEFSSLRYNLYRDFSMAIRVPGTFIIVGVGKSSNRNSNVGFALEVAPRGGVAAEEILIPSGIALNDRAAELKSKEIGIPMLDILAVAAFEAKTRM